MCSPVLDGMARQGALIAILLGAGCATDEQPRLPRDEDLPADPIPELVSSSDDRPVDIAVDDRYVFWINAMLVPDPHGPPLRRGGVVRWDKSTGERVVLATIEDTLPVEVDPSSTYVYWIELGGYLSGGYRELGHDRLLRIAKAGGPAEVVASMQRFDEGERDQVAVTDGYVYWLSDGALRRRAEDGALPAVETVADDLDTPTTLAVSSTKACFRTGDPGWNTSPIWCMPAGGGAIDPIAYDKRPRDMLFFNDHLYWSDDGGSVEHAVPSQGTTIETVPHSTRPIELTADTAALFWTVTGTPSGYAAVKGFVGDTYTIIREIGPSTVRAPASDGLHVYFIEGHHLVRMPARP